MVTGNVAKVGFITTRGHADSISMMNLEGRYAGLGPDEIQNISRTNKPAPLVPRHLVEEIDQADREAMARQQRDQWFDAADSNKDGSLSRAEFDAAQTRRMAGEHGRGPGRMPAPAPASPSDEATTRLRQTRYRRRSGGLFEASQALSMA